MLAEYVAFDNAAWPHQGRDQRWPATPRAPKRDGPMRRWDWSGGLLHDYYRDVA